ncbi:MAG: FecR domain-containing protein [Verrucomicrobiota bacterium]
MKIQLIILTGIVLLAGNLIHAQTTPTASCVSVSGRVTYQLPEQDDPILLAADTPLPIGTKIISSQNGEAIIGMLSGLAINLKENTAVTLLDPAKVPKSEGGDKNKRTGFVDLIEGRMVVLISDEEVENIDFNINTPEGIAKPRGTFYVVMVQEEKAFIAVKEGKVGIEQFSPIEAIEEKPEQRTAIIEQATSYRTTTTSPRG